MVAEARGMVAEAATGVIERMDSSFRVSCSAERELLRDIVELDRTGAWEGDGFNTLHRWMAARYGISSWKARRWAEAGYALESLPKIAAALSCGALSLDKTAELCRFATPKNEDKLLSWARRVTPSAIRNKADSLQRASDAAEPYRHRHVDIYPMTEDTCGLSGVLPTEQALKVKAALDRIAKDLPDLPDDDQSDGNTLERKRADALVLLASNAIAQDADPDRATLVVHASLEALASDSYQCETEDGVALHPDVARRLSCDCRYQVVAHGKNGDVGIGRVAHNVPRWLRRLVAKRDGGCAFPGCSMKTFLHPHHIKHWVLGGPTDLSNLVMLCSIHHTLVHEHHWSVILENEKPMWFRPSGRAYSPGLPIGDDLLGVEQDREEERVRARGPSPGSIEERFGIHNFIIKDIADDWAGRIYETARDLLENQVLVT
ncbi:MAG: DUF222 domain-containing protein [Actinomycetota bacterium]